MLILAEHFKIYVGGDPFVSIVYLKIVSCIAFQYQKTVETFLNLLQFLLFFQYFFQIFCTKTIVKNTFVILFLYYDISIYMYIFVHSLIFVRSNLSTNYFFLCICEDSHFKTIRMEYVHLYTFFILQNNKKKTFKCEIITPYKCDKK